MTALSHDRAALSHDRAGGAAHDLRAWLDAAAELARAVNRGLVPTELGSLIAGTVVHLTGYDFCSVLLPDESGRHLVIIGSYGLSADYVSRVNAERPPGITPGATAEGPSSRAYRSQRPVALTDICADPTCTEWEAAAVREGYRAILALPLTGVGGVLGVVSCYSRVPREFGADEVVLMETFANQAALNLEAAGRREKGRAEQARLRARVAALEDDHRVEQRAEAVHGTLLRLLLAGEPLGRVSEHLARELSADVLVEDATGTPLAVSATSGIGRVPTGPAPPGPRVIDDYRAVEVADGTGLVAPIVLAGELAGRVWAFDVRDPGAPWQRRVLERGASVIALAVSKLRTTQEVEWRLSREFLDDLITAPPDPAVTISRGHQLGVNLSDPHTLLVLRPDPGVPATGLLTQVQHVVNATSAQTLVAARGGDVIVLWPEGAGLPGAREIAERLRGHCTSCSPGSVSVGLGRACHAVTDYAEAYRLAAGALNLTQRAGGVDRVVALGDLGIYRLLLQVEQPDELIEFMEGMLEPLRSYDSQRDAALVETLRAFLRCGCTATTTAEALIVHPNTISYRLHRIEELLGVNLRDPQALLRIQLAFVIEDVLAA